MCNSSWSYALPALNDGQTYQFKASFFCVGDNARKFPNVIEEIKSRGHKTGNHTMHHIKGWSTSTEEYIKDAEQCAAFIYSDLFRPPYGRIKSTQRKILAQRYKIIMWSLLACDFVQGLNTAKALKRLKEKTFNGCIVVFHDSMKCEKNLKIMLPEYLRFLKENGYRSEVL